MNNGFSIKFSNEQPEIRTFISGEFDDFHIQENHLEFLFEGVLLNKKKLLQEYALKDFRTLILELFKNKKENVIKEFEGEFRGFIWDKMEENFYVFTNPTSTKRVFYTQHNNQIFIDSSLVRLNETLKENTIFPSPDFEGFYQLLSFGNMFENKTPLENVYKLLDGHFLKIDIKKTSFSEKKYFEISSSEIYKRNKEGALKEVHERFSLAVKTEYEKDSELNSKHFTQISGGLDSRMAMLYAIQQNQKPDDVFCFSQSEYLDHTISQKIAKDFDINYRFVALDKGFFLKNIDRLTQFSEGTNFHLGSIHVDDAFSKIDKDFKLIHSGQIGGEIMGGSYYESAKPCKPRLSRIATNPDFVKHIEESTQKIFNNYEREDLFLLRNWGFNKTVLGAQVTENFATMVSPFMQVDFLKFMYSIPHEWKYDYQFYFEWFNTYCPEMGNYIWEKSLLKPNQMWKIKFGNKYFKPIFTKISEKIGGLQPKTSMYPYQFYFDQSEEIQHYYQDYFDKNIDRLQHFPELKEEVLQLFTSSNFYTKAQAINILSIFKLYF